MVSLLTPIGALLTGVALLLLGSGLLNTLLALRGELEGYSDQMLGLIMSGYFIGFLIGTFLALPMIRRIGHIRSFACCAALMSCSALLHFLWVNPATWFVLRIATGITLVSLYTVIESWLNGQTAPALRGRVFAVYMIINLGALAAAQQLLHLDSPQQATLFILAAILISTSLVPVTWTRLAQPEVHSVSRMRIRQLARLAPVALVSAICSGLAMGAFWGLAPVYASRIGLDYQHIALFMSTAIIGGALLQYPLGRYSDTHDRRKVLLLASALAALAALAMLLLSFHAYSLLAATLLYGGMAFAIYPLAVAHLMDQLDNSDILAGGSALLLIHGAGSAIGPALAGQLMSILGPQALPLLFIVIQSGLAIYTLHRLHTRQHMPDEHPSAFVAMVRTTPTALEMLPEEEEITESSHGIPAQDVKP